MACSGGEAVQAYRVLCSVHRLAAGTVGFLSRRWIEYA